MLSVYIIGIVFITTLLLITCKYKGTHVNKQNKKDKLLILYPLSTFIVDKFLKGLCNNTKISRELKQISLKEDIEDEKYFYIVHKIALSFLIVIIGLFLGLAICLVGDNPIKNISKLIRHKNPTTYELYAKHDKKEKKIALDVSQKKRTKKEVDQELSKVKKNLIKSILGENKTANRINRPIKFVDSISDVKITWSIDNSDVLGYDGEIGPKVSKKGELVKIAATLELDDAKEQYLFALKVFPKKNTNNLQGALQDYIDSNYLTKKEVKLPKKINGEMISYYIKNTDYAKWIFPLAVILAIFVFIFKDKDLEKEVKERQKQMLREYPNIVSKLLVYFGAGLSIKSALERIVREFKSTNQNGDIQYAYEEIEIAITKMNSGISEATALAEFGERCGLHCYIKLANIIEQNLMRGSRDMIFALKSEVNSAINTRKNEVLKEGSEISTKLLGPMVIMLIIAIVIIIVPAFMSINY